MCCDVWPMHEGSVAEHVRLHWMLLKYIVIRTVIKRYIYIKSWRLLQDSHSVPAQAFHGMKCPPNFLSNSSKTKNSRRIHWLHAHAHQVSGSCCIADASFVCFQWIMLQLRRLRRLCSSWRSHIWLPSLSIRRRVESSQTALQLLHS